MLSFGILNRKIKHFMNLLFICKTIKLQLFWDAFRQHNPNQRNHISAYLTSLITHVQSFKILSTKCIWLSIFILISIQWPSSNWIHWHLVVKHGPCLVHTFIEASITLAQWLWNIFWKIQCHLWRFGQKTHI